MISRWFTTVLAVLLLACPAHGLASGIISGPHDGTNVSWMADQTAKAEKGDVWAMDALAIIYQYGKGVDADTGRARVLWVQAARLGYTPAFYNLGRVYAEGLGVARDPVQAWMYFRLAEKSGDVGGGLKRQEIEKSMPPAQIAEAGKLADGWFKAPPPQEAVPPR